MNRRQDSFDCDDVDVTFQESPDDLANSDASPPVDGEGSNENFKVAIRVRPPLPRELESNRQFINVVRIPADHKSITLCEHLDMDDGRGGVYSTQTFSFDYVYEPAAQQKEVYERSAQSAVMSVLQGYNATVIAYGQTGTGKTFTMEGFTSDEHRGIIPRAIEEIFQYIGSCRQRNMKFLVRASYMQIYNEVISDLLKPLNKQLSVRHTKQRGVYIDGLSEWVVRNPNDVYGLMEKGCSLRATGSTKMSELSSRSHAMFIIIVEVMEGDEANPRSYKFGKLNIVDLAGSENIRQTGVTGIRLTETKNINWSLHELGNVIAALTDPKRRSKHIPFRNSILTHSLQDSLGGNCKTTLIACISPALEAYAESLSTLKFANRAKNIKNDAQVNEDMDQGTLLRKYERELKRLRQVLQEREGGGFVDPNKMTQLVNGKRRAEEDREAALSALEQTSKEIHEEKLTRRRLEDRICELEAMVNGNATTTTLEAHNMASDEYAQKLDELDKERQVMEEDKAQVDRYKQLLLKQRDIMLHLTTRLNERDETILALQEEIDAYDEHIQMLEDAMEASVVPLSTRTEAQEYLARIQDHSRGDVRYSSEGNADHLLTSEEKILELLMVKGRAPVEEHDNLRESDERKSFQIILRDRVEVAVRHHMTERQTALQQEVETVSLKLMNAEEKVRAYEISTRSGQTSSDLRRMIEQEQQSTKQGYAIKLVEVQKELEAEREVRRKVSREIDKHKFELSQLRNLISDRQKIAEIDRLWTTMDQIEGTMQKELLKSLSSPRTPVTAASPSFSEVSKLRQLETTAEQLKSQNGELIRQLKERDTALQSTARSAEVILAKDKEITQLSRSLSTHVKDRRALKTILESRIKVKVDKINDMFSSPGSNERQVLVEIKALQNLVNASITAMDSGDH